MGHDNNEYTEELLITVYNFDTYILLTFHRANKELLFRFGYHVVPSMRSVS